MLALGTEAPEFILPDTEGNLVSLTDFKEACAFLVIFMCNHCPYVKHVLRPMVALIKEYQAKGAAVVGIGSNDVANFPEDSSEMMAKVAKEIGFTFPYLYDEGQDVAKAYCAACTPDFFLFDEPGNSVPVTGNDLRAALDAVLQGKQVPSEQKPSIGCNIKWKQGNEPDYAR
jgi:peroxiredoxin